MTTLASTSKAAPTSDLTFDGSNWLDLSRLFTLAQLFRASGTEVDSDRTQSTWVARHFTGAALDWVTTILSSNHTLLDSYTRFEAECRDHFGITDALVRNHTRTQLEALKWRNDLPTFFAEFDRLAYASGLGQGDQDAKTVLLLTKLPPKERAVLSAQAYQPTTYSELRSRLLTSWTLNPTGPAVKVDKEATKKPRCGKCKRRGHTAAECKSSEVKPEKA